jgi:ankyrin repeat protein
MGLMSLNMLGILQLILLLLGLAACGKRPSGPQIDRDIQTSAKPSSDDQKVMSIAHLEEVRVAIDSEDEAKIREQFLKYPEIQYGSINSLMKNGETLLTYAIAKGFEVAQNILIELGADINAPNIKNETPLIVATKYSRNITLSKLLFEKAKIDLKDIKGNTALIWSIKKKDEEIALKLISSGANVDIINDENKNAHAYAQDEALQKVLELLSTRLQVEHGTADASSFISVIQTGDYKTLNLMIDKSSKIVQVYEDVNPLVLVLDVKDQNTAMKMVEVLINYGAPINGAKNATITPLIRATQLEKTDFVRIYLDVPGINVNQLDSSGESALIHAVKKNNLEIVNLLIRNYADKKYTYYPPSGKKRVFSACNLAHNNYEILKDVKEIALNEKIRERLGCGLSWFRRHFKNRN